ncbi:hypothetical protein D3D01_16675 [Haloarcula sp. Atlit-7R]|nr:hypothetical protein D3D01_16675 [Haloarcula sp. Atlit-7R]
MDEFVLHRNRRQPVTGRTERFVYSQSFVELPTSVVMEEYACSNDSMNRPVTTVGAFVTWGPSRPLEINRPLRVGDRRQ